MCTDADRLHRRNSRDSRGARQGLITTRLFRAHLLSYRHRIEITFATGEALNEDVLPNGDHVYDFFDGKLTVRIVTFRPEDQPSLLPGVSTLHSEWAAGVRALLQERVGPFTTEKLPFYAVKTIRPLATQRDLDPPWLEDFTRLEFAVEFGIRSDAWPNI